MSRSYPPGPKGNFISGNQRQFRQDPLGFILNASRYYGDLVHLQFFGTHAYLLNHPDFVHYALVEAPEKFHKAGRLKRRAARVAKSNLLTSEDEFHQQQRRLVQPAFHSRQLAAYVPTMVDHTRRFLTTWSNGQRDLFAEMNRLTLNIIGDVLLGIDLPANPNSRLNHLILTHAQPLAGDEQPLVFPGVRQGLRQLRMIRSMDAVITAIIQQRRAAGTNGTVHSDLLSILMASSDKKNDTVLSDDQLHDHTLTVFLAGHGPTAIALTWTLYLLAQHSAVEMQLLSEFRQVLGGRMPTADDLPQLAYTEMVVKEALRLYPPAWGFTRQVVEPVTIGGYHINPGDLIVMSPYAMHHDPRLFEQPERFMPERFAPSAEDRLPRYAYFPFGGGPRVCIGNHFAIMEAVLVLAVLLPQYQFLLPPGVEVTPDTAATLRPKGGLPIRLKRRERALA